MTLRSGDADRLRSRQRLERALSGVDWAPPGLAPHAILLVRRLAVRIESLAALTAPVSLALERWTARARRPWIHDDASRAEAVVFSDEAELVACLIRDRLRGVVADRWWWHTLLRGVDAEAWLRTRVLPRGDIIVSALRLLAPRSEIVPWIARLHERDLDVVMQAASRAFAVCTSEPPGPARTEGTQIEPQDDAPAGPLPVSTSHAEARAIARLISIVPEIRVRSLDRAHRRLLALLGVLLRVPPWARSSQFAAALAAIDRVDVARVATGDHSFGEAPPPRGRVESHFEPPCTRAPIHTIDPAQTASVSEDSSSELTVASAEAATIRALRSGSDRPTHHAEGAPANRPEPSETAVGHRSAPIVRSQTDTEPGTDLAASVSTSCASSTHSVAFTSSAEPDVSARREHVVHVETGYGGIFYLLNVWIALGVYADFTAPRGENFVLSPWDLLATVGRAWFDEAFVADPVWDVLADLAVRDPCEDPVRASDLPNGWLDEHIEMVTARLGRALDAADGCDIPAFVCCHHARLEVTAAALHVHLGLAELPLQIRIAGLDRDPGWIPAAGRAVSFHFA